MKIRNVLLLSCLLGAVDLFAQSQIHLLPANSWDSNKTHQVVWDTEPGVRYELQQSGSLTNWSAVEGYPTQAVQYADAHAFNVVSNPATAQFFKVVEYDEQPPALSNLIPYDGAFAIPRFNSPISLSLSDVSGVDPSSISMTVSNLGTFTVSSTELSYTNGVLIFDMGGDTALGSYGTNVQVSLVAADVNGYIGTNSWAFDLELEDQIAGDVFVLGSLEAQRAGQQLSPQQQMVFRAVYPDAGPIRMSATAAPWTLVEVGEDYLVFDYTSSPPSFQIDQFLANAAPGMVDEIFYRKVVSVTDDGVAMQITVETVDVSMFEIFAQASLLVNPLSHHLAVYKIAQDGLMVQGNVAFEIGDSFSESIDFSGTPITCTLDGEWAFTPELTMAFDIQGAQLEDFYFRYEGNSSIRVSPSITATGGFSKTVTTDPPIFTSYNVYYVGQAGPVPIWIDLTFSLNAEVGVEVDASATFTAEIQRNKSFFVEVVYSSRDPEINAWNYSPPETDLTKNFDYEMTGHGKAWAKLIPQVDVRLESLFGVYANLTPELGFEGDAVFSGGELQSAAFGLYGKIDLNAGMSVIGLSNDDLPAFPSKTLVHYPWQVEYPVPSSLSFIDQPDTQIANLGGSAYFSCSVSPDQGVEYQWYQNNVPQENETSRTLTRYPVTDGHAGTYWVTATVDGETVESEHAILMVGYINLIQNGDFSAGNTGFTSALRYNSSSLIGSGQYCITSDPSSLHYLAPPYGDYTTGDGNMMMVNGSSGTANLVVYSTTIDIEPHQNYLFSMAVSRWAGGVEPILQVKLNDDVIIDDLIIVDDAGIGIWKIVAANWNSGSSTTVTIKIINENTATGGNDFSLDDIRLIKR